MELPEGPDSRSAVSPLKQLAKDLRLAGIVCFWSQFILTLVAGLIVLTALFRRSFDFRQVAPQSGTGLALACAGIAILGFAIYWDFRLIRFADRLAQPSPSRPSKANTIQHLRVSLIANLVGMLLTLISAEWNIGLLMVKAASIPSGAAVYTSNLLITPLDIFIIASQINLLLAQFIGIVAALWLLERITRKPR